MLRASKPGVARTYLIAKQIERNLSRVTVKIFLLALITSNWTLAWGEHPFSALDNLRSSVDVSTRVIRSGGRYWTQAAVGLDIHNVFSNNNGDFGTLVFQPYLVRIDNAPAVSTLFSDNHDTALQWRIANFNYTGLGRGRFNIRVGHFELPFGLEHVIQTNGTLNQMNAPATTGLKADWGVSINGELPQFEYELAYMRGGGNEIHSNADGYLVGRIGTPRSHSWWAAVSLMEGETDTGQSTVERHRKGIDVGVRLAHGLHVMAEYAQGEDNDQAVSSVMAEIGATSTTETTLIYLQWRYSQFREATQDDARQINFGLRYEPNAHWSTSVEVNHNLDIRRHRNAVMLQLRYRV